MTPDSDGTDPVEPRACEAMFYRSDFWEQGLREELYSYAWDNNQSRVYQYYDDYHMLDHSYDRCAPEWSCQWEECAADELNAAGDTCWKEQCSNDCDKEMICKFWHAYEYDYSSEEWLWDIEDSECPRDFDEQLEYQAENLGNSAEDVVDFLDYHYEDSLDMIQD